MAQRQIYDRSNLFSGGDVSDGLALGSSRVVSGLGRPAVITINNPGGASVRMQRRRSDRPQEQWSYVGSTISESTATTIALQASMDYRWVVTVAGASAVILTIRETDSETGSSRVTVTNGEGNNSSPSSLLENEVVLKWSLGRAQEGYWTIANPLVFGSNGVLYRLNPNVGGGIQGNPEINPTLTQGTAQSSWIAVSQSGASAVEFDSFDLQAPLVGVIPDNLPTGSESGVNMSLVRFYREAIVVYTRDSDGWAETIRYKPLTSGNPGAVDSGDFEDSIVALVDKPYVFMFIRTDQDNRPYFRTTEGGGLTWKALPDGTEKIPGPTVEYVDAGLENLEGKLLEKWVSPEDYGAIGDGVADDTDALEAMTDEARERGYLNMIAKPKAIYTTTEPCLFAGIEYQRHHWNGASLMNTKGTSDAETLIVQNYESGLSLPTVFSDTGAGNIAGPYYIGEKINTVTARSTVVNVTGSMTNVGFFVGADVMLYGCKKAGDGFPPDPAFFEYNKIKSITGSQIELENPLKYEYREDWPEAADPATDFGEARIISLQRGAEFTAIKYLEIHDLNTVANPAWQTSVSGEGRNGRVSIQGFIQARVYNLRTDAISMYIGQGRDFYGDNLSPAGQKLEMDKCLSTVHLKNTNLTELLFASGVNDVNLDNVNVSEKFLCAPTESLIVNGGLVSAFDNNSKTGASTKTNQVSFKNTEFFTDSSVHNKLLHYLYRSQIFTKVSDTQLSMPYSDYFTSLLPRCVNRNTVLYKDGEPAFRLSTTPYVSGTDVLFDGTQIQSIGATEELHYSTQPDHVSFDNCNYTGSHGPRLRLNREPDYTHFVTYKVNSDFETEDEIIVLDSHIPPEEGFYIRMSKMFCVDEIHAHVIRPYTGSDAVATMNIRHRLLSGGGPVLASINLKTAGIRRITHAGDTGMQTGDSSDLIGFGLEKAPAWRIDRTANLSGTELEQPLWKVIYKVTRTF